MASSPESGRLTHVHQIAIRVQDLERAVAFYRDVLQLPLLFQAPPGLAFFDCGGVRLMLSKPEQPEFDHPASILYYGVADIQAAHAALASRGVTFRAPPHLLARLPDREVWMAFFADSEDNPVALMSEVPIQPS